MTPEEKKNLKALIITTNLYYGRQMDDAVVLMQIQDLEDLPFFRLAEAFNKYRRDPANKFPPLPAAIRSMLCPELSQEQLALEASNKIVEAMALYGWPNPDKARAFMGEIAWEVVRREGGWAALCERTKNEDLPILKAQWRMLSGVVSVRQKQIKEQHLLESVELKALVDE